MKQGVWGTAFFIWFTVFFISCGMVSDDENHDKGFQDNGVSHSDAAYPDFKLLDIFDGRGSLEEIWDSIDAKEANPRLTCTINTHTDEFIIASDVMARILRDDSQLVPGIFSVEMANILGLIQDETPYFVESPDDIGAFYMNSGDVYTHHLYTFLDKLWENDQRPGDLAVAAMGKKIISRMLDKKTPADIRDDMQDLADDITDDDFDRDFNLLASLFGKLTIQADYPLWVDENGVPLNRDDIDPSFDTLIGTGNAVSGMNTLFSWMQTILADDYARYEYYGLIRENAKVFDPREESDNAEKLKTLLRNIEDHFTVGGSVYETDPRYKSTDDDPTYTDTELGQTIRECLPFIIQFMARSDRAISLMDYHEGRTPHYILRETIRALRQIGYDPNVLSFEDSMTTLMKHDLLGRDRTVEGSGAFPASMLESFWFLSCVTSNIGFADGGDTDEVSSEENPTDTHGHGDYTEALTLNDTLISISTSKTMGRLGIFEISMLPGDEEFLSRSYVPFTTENRDDYQFDFDSNYPILRALAGTCAGDYGHRDGGNKTGESPANNEYTPFSPTGIGETQLAAWTMNWVVRSCFGGEGPYYHADPDARTVRVNGKDYHEYLRPDGRVYALVNKDHDTWEYLYPTDERDAEDPETDVIAGYGEENHRQRFNRYKSTWHTDYYMYSRSKLNVSLDNSGGKLDLVPLEDGEYAHRLTYSELIPEDDANHIRSCATPEEAFFRNFQWVYTEKKMVSIIPQSLTVDLQSLKDDGLLGILLDLAGKIAYGVEYTVFEAHGWSGLANMRRFSENHVWAKNGTNGSSDVPGDYRIELVCEVESDINLGYLLVMAGLNRLLNEDTIYEDTMGRGLATPAIVGKNLPALYRLAFPVSPAMSHGTDITDRELGSREFEVGDEIWQQRNAMAPLTVSMFHALTIDRVEYPDYDPHSLKSGLRGNINGLAPLLKPLIYYAKSTDEKPPYKTWKVRVQGTNLGDWEGEPYLCPTGEFPDAETMRWDGSDEEWTHFQPAVLKTMLNILIDSDITAPVTDGKRMDGCLPLLLQNKAFTHLLNILMSDANDSDGLYAALEQIYGAIRFTEGTHTAINRAEGASKPVPFPDWMFAKGNGADAFGFYTDFTGVRKEDMIYDIGLDRMIGHDSDLSGEMPRQGYGLSCYVDEQENENWEGLDKDLDTLENLLYPDTEDTPNPYSLVEEYINLIDAVFHREEPYSSEQIEGYLYTLGKLFARFDPAENRFAIQGEPGFDDVYRLLKIRLPALHDLVKDDTGNHYHALLTLNRAILSTLNECGTQGLCPYLLDAMSTDDGAEAVINDLKTFFTDDIVADQGPLWITLSELLSDLAKAVDDSKDGTLLNDVYENYGFQRND